ncbi:uncharacterized protein LOC110614755 [Manihot esculenta]|uniref:Uncharacterized protein n=1 Tax=Manihot esculenta TaxID=3983 RepID=A0A2C9VY14_MANES|nr:uncharacterized protein LOC110614755 [Manihot esculenta]OAY50389.1 hypothetical protein MANES_05G131900v8 [Manihot esculenta]
MAHSLATPPPAASPSPFSTKSTKNTTTHVPSLGFHRDSKPLSHCSLLHRRTVSLGLAGALVGLNIGDRSANAAARRPPPPPPQEKKDPNLSGVQAKVLASKKRKEAMKEFAAKQREKGKPINQPSQEE